MGYFGTIFQTKKSEWDLDPPTHFHSNLGCLEKNSLQSPLHDKKKNFSDIDLTHLTSKQQIVYLGIFFGNK